MILRAEAGLDEHNNDAEERKQPTKRLKAATAALMLVEKKMVGALTKFGYP
ncbi:hypothetical protein BN128_1183 [Cronobacter sakazakii 696]|nr:hypothetical protein BN128_1183 [Cronobacter sakazakii 696]